MLFLKSKNNTAVKFPLSSSSSHVSINFIKAVWQEWLLLNPDCCFINKSFLTRYIYNCLDTVFSNNLDTVGNIEMGRKLFGSDLSPPLKTGVKLAYFKTLGKIPVHKLKLMIWVSDAAITDCDSFNILGPIPSVPVDLSTFKNLRNLETSSTVTV